LSDYRDMELISPEISLWREVLHQAVSDATLRRKISATGKHVLKAAAGISRERAQARDWLTSFGRDFRMVCALAGLDPQAVHDRAMRIAQQGWALPQGRSCPLSGLPSDGYRGSAPLGITHPRPSLGGGG
jgi:hypothetical protein